MIPGEQYYLTLLATILTYAVETQLGFTFLELYASMIEYDFSDVWQMVEICIQAGIFSKYHDDKWFHIDNKDHVRAFLKVIGERKSEHPL